MDVNKKLKPINRSEANLEAEKGETVISKLFGVNVPEHYIIEGEKHSKGGTPLKLPNESFIFSNSNELRIVDKEILDNFDMPKNRKGYTPAEIAKKYSINEYKAKLLDPNIDNIERESAILMLNNRFDKLSELAIIQESMKGFPNGIPSIALAYLEKNNIKPEELLPNETDINAFRDNLKEEKKYVYGSSVNDYDYIPPNSKSPTDFVKPPIDFKTLSNILPLDIRNMMFGKQIKTGENKTVADKTGTDQTGTDKTGEDKTEGDKTGGDKTGEDKTGTDKTGDENKTNRTTYTIPGFQIASGLYLNLSANEMKARERAIQERQLLDKFNPEDASPYTTSSIGDYVETGTQYGAFRPTSQTYAVNPQNIVTNKINLKLGGQPQFDKGGKFSEEEKQKILKKLGLNNKNDIENVVFVDDDSIDVDNVTDKNKIYVYKDKNNNNKIIYRRFGRDASDYDDSNTNSNSNERIISSYRKGINDSITIINTKIEELEKQIPNITNENDKQKYDDKLKKLYILKKHFGDLSKELNDENFIKNLSSNKLITGKSEHSPFYSTSLKEDEIKVLQSMYSDNDPIFDELGLQRVTPGYNEKNQLSGISPVDGKMGNTTFFYGAIPKNAFKYKHTDTEINIESPKLDLSKIKDDKQRAEYNPFFTQDINNLNLALSEKAKIKKYIPYQSVPDTFLPDATFVSPERSIAANQESVNMFSNAASTLGDANTYAATSSLLAGQAFANNANIVGQTHNTNVGIANNNENIRTQILNNASMQKANLSTSLFDKATIANQQFDNAMLQARRNIVRAINNAWTNRGLAQQMNATSDKFMIDPQTYMVYRKENSDTLSPTKEKNEFLNNLEEITTYLEGKDLDNETKKAIITAYMNSKKDDKTKLDTNKQTPFEFDILNNH